MTETLIAVPQDVRLAAITAYQAAVAAAEESYRQVAAAAYHTYDTCGTPDPTDTAVLQGELQRAQDGRLAALKEARLSLAVVMGAATLED
jgi:hypothetical protein